MANRKSTEFTDRRHSGRVRKPTYKINENESFDGHCESDNSKINMEGDVYDKEDHDKRSTRGKCAAKQAKSLTRETFQSATNAIGKVTCKKDTNLKRDSVVKSSRTTMVDLHECENKSKAGQKMDTDSVNECGTRRSARCIEKKTKVNGKGIQTNNRLKSTSKSSPKDKTLSQSDYDNEHTGEQNGVDEDKHEASVNFRSRKRTNDHAISIGISETTINIKNKKRTIDHSGGQSGVDEDKHEASVNFRSGKRVKRTTDHTISIGTSETTTNIKNKKRTIDHVKGIHVCDAAAMNKAKKVVQGSPKEKNFSKNCKNKHGKSQDSTVEEIHSATDSGIQSSGKRRTPIFKQHQNISNDNGKSTYSERSRTKMEKSCGVKKLIDGASGTSKTKTVNMDCESTETDLNGKEDGNVKISTVPLNCVKKTLSDTKDSIPEKSKFINDGNMGRTRKLAKSKECVEIKILSDLFNLKEGVKSDLETNATEETTINSRASTSCIIQKGMIFKTETVIDETMVEESRKMQTELKIEEMKTKEMEAKGRQEVEDNEERKGIDESQGLEEINDLEERKVKVKLKCEVKKELGFQCEECGKIITSASTFTKHMLIHSGRRPFVCDICGLSFPLKDYLARHMICHNGKRTHECTDCEKKFYRRSNLTAHMLVHNAETQYPCTDCENTFKTEKLRDCHMKHHRPKRHVCDECGKTFINDKCLRKHRNLHTAPDNKPFRCDKCGKSFAYNQSLQEHVRRHRGEKPVSCTLCDKSFNNKRELSSHMRYHESKTDFPCTLCNLYYDSKQSLKKHIYMTHRKPDTCKICNQTFKNTRMFKQHMFREHRDKRERKLKVPADQLAKAKKVVCKFCDRVFYNRYVLSKHLMSKHNFSPEAMKTLLQIRDKVTMEKGEGAVKWGPKGNYGTLSAGSDEKDFKVYYKDDEMAVFVKMGKDYSVNVPNRTIVPDESGKAAEEISNNLKEEPGIGQSENISSDEILSGGIVNNQDRQVRYIYVQEGADIGTVTVDEKNVQNSRNDVTENVQEVTGLEKDGLEQMLAANNQSESVLNIGTTVSNEQENNVYLVVSDHNNADDLYEHLTEEQEPETGHIIKVTEDDEHIVFIVNKEGEDQTITINGEQYEIVATEERISEVINDGEIVVNDSNDARVDRSSARNADGVGQQNKMVASADSSESIIHSPIFSADNVESNEGIDERFNVRNVTIDGQQYEIVSVDEQNIPEAVITGHMTSDFELERISHNDKNDVKRILIGHEQFEIITAEAPKAIVEYNMARNINPQFTADTDALCDIRNVTLTDNQPEIITSIEQGPIVTSFDQSPMIAQGSIITPINQGPIITSIDLSPVANIKHSIQNTLEAGCTFVEANQQNAENVIDEILVINSETGTVHIPNEETCKGTVHIPNEETCKAGVESKTQNVIVEDLNSFCNTGKEFSSSDASEESNFTGINKILKSADTIGTCSSNVFSRNDSMTVVNGHNIPMYVNKDSLNNSSSVNCSNSVKHKETACTSNEITDVVVASNEVTDVVVASNEITDVVVASNEVTDVIVASNEVTDVVVASNEVTDVVVASNEVTDVIVASNEVTDVVVASNEVTDVVVARQSVDLESVVPRSNSSEEFDRFEHALKDKATEFENRKEYSEYLDKMMKTLLKAKQGLQQGPVS